MKSGRKRGGRMKHTMIILVLGLLLAFGCGKDETSGRGDAAAPDKPPAGGTVTAAGSDRSAGMGLPAEWGFLDYPGATKEDGTGQETDWDERGFRGGTFFTTDRLGKVTAFYIEQLASRDPRILETALAGGKTVTITFEEVGQHVAIVLTGGAGDSGTRISITL
jgi:hypothetical protein